jgi:uncharacterized Zn finger protein
MCPECGNPHVKVKHRLWVETKDDTTVECGICEWVGTVKELKGNKK